MNRAPWTVAIVLALVLGIGIGAGAGLVHGTAPLGSHNSNLHPDVCSYPTIVANQAHAGSSAGVTLATTSGDLLVVVGIVVDTLGHGTPTNVLTASVDSFTLQSYFDYTAAYAVNETVWAATASMTTSETLAVTGSLLSGTWDSMTSFDLGGVNAMSLGSGVGTTTASLALSATGAGCDRLVSAWEEIDGFGSTTTYATAPNPWTGDAASNGLDTFLIGSNDTTVVGGGSNAVTITGITGSSKFNVGQMLAFDGTTIASPPATAPTGLVATTLTDSSIFLAWTNPVGESLTDANYSIWVGTTCAGAGTPTDLGYAGTYQSVIGLSVGTHYSFEVAVSNATGFGPESNCASNVTFIFPLAPTGLGATTISTTQINVAWTNPVDPYLTDNYVNQYAGAACSGSPLVIDMSAVTNFFADTGLTPGTTYSFTAQAYSAGGGLSNASNCDTNSTFSAPPLAPTGLVASTEPLSPPHNYGETLIDLTWVNPPGTVTDNHVYVYRSDCATPVTSYDLGGPHTGATIGSLTPGTSYCFAATASNLTGEGLASAFTKASINATLPVAPTAVVVTAFSTALLSIGWTDPAGNLTGVYTAEAFAPNDCGGVVLFTVTGSLANPYLWGIVSAGRSACIEVAANTSGGMGPFSTPTSRSINATLPDPVTGATNATVSSSEIDLAWTNPSGNLTVVTIVTYAGGSCGGAPLTVFSIGVTTSYHATGLSPSTTYSFAVIAHTSGGAGAFSCQFNTTLATPPPPPPVPIPIDSAGFLLVGLFLLLVVLVILGMTDRRRKETR